MKKKSTQTPSLDDCLDDLSQIIKELREMKSRQTTEAEEMAKVNQILKEDGYSESDMFFAQALNVVTNRTRRRAFLDLETKTRADELRECLLGHYDFKVQVIETKATPAGL